MKQIVAFGGGGFSMESGNPLLDDYVMGLTGSAEPKVCFLPTASGDADHYLVRFYSAFRERARPSHISLFRRERGVSDVRSHLLSQDLIYVGGGSLLSLLGVWRAHGIDEILREAWEAGRRHVRPQRRLALLVHRGGQRLPRRGQPGRGRSASSPTRTRSTTARATAARPSTSTCSTACATATRPRTARRCGSSATSWSRSSPRGPRRAPTGSSGAARLVRETRLATRYLGANTVPPVLPVSVRRAASRPEQVSRGGRILVLGGHEFNRREGNDAIVRRDRRARGLEPPADLPAPDGERRHRTTRSRSFHRAFGERDCHPSCDLALPPRRSTASTSASTCWPRT